MAKRINNKKTSVGVVRDFLGDRRNGDVSLSFFAYVMLLLVIGLAMMASASYAWSYNDNDGDGLYYAKKQAMNAVIGFIAMLFFMKMDYHNFKKIRLPFLKKFNIAGLLYIVGLVFLGLVLVMGSDEGGDMGATRWLVLGPINFQPSEVAKFTIIIFFAYSMERDGEKMNKFSYGIVKYVLLLAPYALCIYLQPHLSGLVLVGTIAIAMILCGGANKIQFSALFASGISLMLGIIKWQSSVEGSYVAKRIKSWQDPFADILNDTWQTANSLIAIGSGGLFGLGLGNSRQKYLYLPETKNDFVFPIVCEELGFVGALAIIIIFLLLVIEGYTIAARCKDRFGTLIAVGITTQIGIQTIFNLAVVSNLIPNTGISLPFFSYGGTALIMQLAEMGIMLNISQQRYYPEPESVVQSDGEESPSPELKNA